ncbi:serine protease [Patulibacter minatonensis]|uniref:serine protease n=1 Tax=Patulibacter minatonensis TaxID=298163 RepID=UPI0004796893|nr:serine protease [Patulibacter minatonensis]
MPEVAPSVIPSARRLRGTTPTGPRRRRALVLVAGVVAVGAVVPAGAQAASTRGLSLGAAPSSASSPAAPRIVGGTATTIAAVPYQVRIRGRDDGKPWGTAGAYGFSSCGGAIISPTQILTAAHCTFEGATPIPAQSYLVNAGFSRFDNTSGSGSNPKPLAGDTPQAVRVASVRRHPGYQPSADGTGTLESLDDDVAVLTLSKPLTYDANAAPIALPDPAQSPVGPARISGFGLQSDGGTPDGSLYLLDTPLIDAASSEDAGGAGSLNAVYAVSLSPIGSTCQGDSGGPLVQNGRVVGVVSSGPRCGAGSPSYYTNIAAPEILAFVQGSDAPPVAPRGGQDVRMTALSATPKTGDTLVCNPGTWSGAPAYAIGFVDTRNGRVLQYGATGSYKLQQADLGATVSCSVIATTAGGAGRTPPTRSTPGIAQGPRPRLSTRVSAASKARRRTSLAVKLVIRNTGGVLAHGLTTCIRPGKGIAISSRGGGRAAGGQLCWTNSSLSRVMSKRFGLQVTRRARRGRATLATISVTAADAPAVRSTRRITIRR